MILKLRGHKYRMSLTGHIANARTIQKIHGRLWKNEKFCGERACEIIKLACSNNFPFPSVHYTLWRPL